MKEFYSHIVEIDSLIIELDKMDLSPDEKMHLAKLIDSNIHHTVLDAVLSELSEEDKRIFLKHLHDGNHEKVWKHLNSKVDKIEEKIKKAAEELKVELHKDIKEAHNLKGGK